MYLLDELLDRAVVARVPVLIKAMPADSSGRRIVEVEASTEEKDLEGDVILQSALMGSADSFVAKGHLDLDHLSELGARLGIPDPSSYVVGRPIEVKAMPGGRTFVKGEIARSRDGSFDPSANRYDEFWASLQRDPPVRWFSSIYGFPDDFDDCQKGACGAGGATRFLVKSIDWRSLAFTRNPVNNALRSPTRIVTAKSYVAEMLKSMTNVPTRPETVPVSTPPVVPPLTLDDVWSVKACDSCLSDKYPSLFGYRRHFEKCLGYPAGAADLFAHAVMHRHGSRGIVGG